MSQLARSNAFSADSHERHNGMSVDYVRGGVTLNVIAVFGQLRATLDDELGVLETVMRDFLIRPKWFTSLNPAEPQRGDIIVAIDAIGRFEYQVGAAASDSAEPPWRWADPHHNAMRVHTTRIRQSV